jgi:chromosome segregation ATPase
MEQAVAIARIERDLESHDQRIASIHSRLGEMQVHQSDQQTEVKVMANELQEARSDIEDSKRELSAAIAASRKEQSEAVKGVGDKFDKKFDTLITGVRWGTGTLIALIGVLVTILLQAH